MARNKKNANFNNLKYIIKNLFFSLTDKVQWLPSVQETLVWEQPAPQVQP